MLSKDDNELLCRVGPGTPMGDLMRQYWIPAIPSNELPLADCPPVRIRLLGENLIAFRTTSGDVGLIQNACPHRGASMFFGRNEEEGLRCVYHGWKFDVTGACVDMPSEPAESNFKTKVRTPRLPDAASATASSGPTWVAAATTRRRCPTSRPTCWPTARRDMYLLSPREQLDAGLGRRDGHRARRLPALRRHPRRGHAARHLRLLPGAQRARPLQRDRHGVGHLVRRRAGRPRKTATTGASRTSCSRSTPWCRPASSASRCASAPTCRWTTTTR